MRTISGRKLRGIIVKSFGLCVLMLFAMPAHARAQTALGKCTKKPLVISAPGSYILKHNLTPTAGTDCVDVSVADVSINLNGFAIIGPASGTGVGINADQDNVTVYNGTVTRMGKTGVVVGNYGIVQGMRVNSNDGDGIDAGTDSKVSNSTADADSGIGISAGERSVISNSSANGSSGNYAIACGDKCRLVGNTANDTSAKDESLSCGASCTIADNSVNGNGTAAGIICGDMCRITGNTVNSMRLQGIQCGNGCVIAGNTADSDWFGIVTGDDAQVSGNTANGAVNEGIETGANGTVFANSAGGDGHGIQTGGSGTVVGNSVSNDGNGLVLGSNTGYAQNVMDSEASGTVSGGTAMGTNVCNGTTTCP